MGPQSAVGAGRGVVAPEPVDQHHEEARARMVDGARFARWTRLPLIDHDLVIGLGALAHLRGDEEEATRLLGIPGLGVRHPGTLLVATHHRVQLGLPLMRRFDPKRAVPQVAAALASLT